MAGVRNPHSRTTMPNQKSQTLGSECLPSLLPHEETIGLMVSSNALRLAFSPLVKIYFKMREVRAQFSINAPQPSVNRSLYFWLRLRDDQYCDVQFVYLHEVQDA